MFRRAIEKSGVSGYDVIPWHGIIGPKGLPGPVVTRINHEVDAILYLKEAAAVLERDGVAPAGGPPKRLQSLVTRARSACGARWSSTRASRRNNQPLQAKELTMAARSVGFGLIAFLLGAGTASAASPAQLAIKLQDSSNDPSIAHMRIVLDHEAVKPGRVTLTAENQSKTLVHELLVARAPANGQLPLDAKADRVNEKRAHPLGEISDLAPGKSGKLTLNLKAGTYILFCNQPGHYKDGMRATLVVAP